MFTVLPTPKKRELSRMRTPGGRSLGPSQNSTYQSVVGLNKTLYVKCLALHLAHRKLPQVVAVVTTINMYSRQNNDPPPPQKMSLETVNILCYMVKRMKVADRIKVANQLTLKWEDYPGLAPYVITRVLPGRERGRRVRTREMAA